MSEDGQQVDGLEAEATQWFARLKSVPVSRETLDAFFAWRRVPAHDAAFDKVERLWSATGSVADDPAIIALARSAYERGGKRYRPRIMARLVPASAAVVAIAAAALLGPRWWSGDAYATKVGEQSIVTLEDGSKVRLDTDTRLMVRFSPDRRLVELERGQAYFTVAHNKARPFVVDADGTGVVATGTQFDVRREGAAIDVTLVEGSVNVKPASQAATPLVAGQQISLRAGQAPVVRAVNTSAATAWTQGRLVFDRVPLEDAIAEVNRYAGRPLLLADDRLAREQVGGTFETGNRDAFVTAVTALLPLTAVHDSDGTIRLVGATANTEKKSSGL